MPPPTPSTRCFGSRLLADEPLNRVLPDEDEVAHVLRAIDAIGIGKHARGRSQLIALAQEQP
jgi:hypothetical protein